VTSVADPKPVRRSAGNPPQVMIEGDEPRHAAGCLRLSTALFVVVGTFLASCVEAIEAVTIVVGVGATRGWRSVWLGVAAALAVLALVVAVFGLTLAALPIGPLRLLVGTVLLIFGLGWLRKGIRRVAAKGLAGDQFDQEIDADVPASGVDWTAFVLAFKGVLLEGLEVAFIVVTFGVTAHQLGLATAAGLAAALLTALVGVAVHPALRRLPRSVLILVVGLLLSTFGTFWSVEGLGLDWPGGDGAILYLLALYIVAATGFLVLERSPRVGAAAGAKP
jgi:uncharacterized membrane protein